MFLGSQRQINIDLNSWAGSFDPWQLFKSCFKSRCYCVNHTFYPLAIVIFRTANQSYMRSVRIATIQKWNFLWKAKSVSQNESWSFKAGVPHEESKQQEILLQPLSFKQTWRRPLQIVKTSAHSHSCSHSTTLWKLSFCTDFEWTLRLNVTFWRAANFWCIV